MSFLTHAQPFRYQKKHWQFPNILQCVTTHFLRLEDLLGFNHDPASYTRWLVGWRSPPPPFFSQRLSTQVCLGGGADTPPHPFLVILVWSISLLIEWFNLLNELYVKLKLYLDMALNNKKINVPQIWCPISSRSHPVKFFFLTSHFTCWYNWERLCSWDI